MIKVTLLDTFLKRVKALRKKYPNVSRDVDPIIDQLEVGETPGDQLQNFDPYIVYKVRVPNRDAQRGKSGGYRVLYYLHTVEKIYLIYIYSKSEQDDVPDSLILAIIKDAEIAANQEAMDEDSPPAD